MVLGRVAGANEVRCLEATARRVAAPDLVELIDDADRRWRPDVILFESNAAFEGIKDLLVRHARFGPKVKGVSRAAARRRGWRRSACRWRTASFRLKGDGESAGAVRRDDDVPVRQHDDLLDAAATGTAYLLDRPEPRVWV